MNTPNIGEINYVSSNNTFKRDANQKAFFRLVGVVAFTPGHYTAYCLRSSGNWQWFDDMNRSNKLTVSCKSNEDIEPHLVVYVRANINEN